MSMGEQSKLKEAYPDESIDAGRRQIMEHLVATHGKGVNYIKNIISEHIDKFLDKYRQSQEVVDEDIVAYSGPLTSEII